MGLPFPSWGFPAQRGDRLFNLGIVLYGDGIPFPIVGLFYAAAGFASASWDFPFWQRDFHSAVGDVLDGGEIRDLSLKKPSRQAGTSFPYGVSFARRWDSVSQAWIFLHGNGIPLSI